MGRNYISEHAGNVYDARPGDELREERRDVFSAELSMGDSVYVEPGELREAVYRIRGAGQSRGVWGEEWSSGVGTGLLVSRAAIPALMRVLADLLEHGE